MASELQSAPGVPRLEEVGRAFNTLSNHLEGFLRAVAAAEVTGLHLHGSVEPSGAPLSYLGVNYLLKHVFESHRVRDVQTYMTRLYIKTGADTPVPAPTSFLLAGPAVYFDETGNVYESNLHETGLKLVADAVKVFGLLATGHWGKPVLV